MKKKTDAARACAIAWLSELSDEPSNTGWNRTGFSMRLLAVLERLTENSVRIENALDGAGILTLSKLEAMTPKDLLRVKNLGAKHIRRIEQALAWFDIRLAQGSPLVVRDGASAIEAHAQRLQKWIDERLKLCEAKEQRGIAGAVHEITEREVLADVMLILDGREPTNKRYWAIEEINRRARDLAEIKRLRAVVELPISMRILDERELMANERVTDIAPSIQPGDRVTLPDGNVAVVEKIVGGDAYVVEWTKTLGRGPWIFPVSELVRVT